MKKIIISVSNDLHSDNRVNKVALSLTKNGFDVLLVGRRLHSKDFYNDKFPTKRFRLIFNSGAFFYAALNFRLFFFLLFKKADIFLSNDLDTLPANFIAAKIRRKKLVYDSHELFTEVPELQNRLSIKRIWERIEKAFLPKIKYAYTVCNSIAEYYKKKYGINMLTVRNIPLKQSVEINEDKSLKINLPVNKKIVIYQGALNKGRGLEYAIEAFKYIENAVLLIIGGGDIENNLKDLTDKLNLNDKVIFTGRLAFSELYTYTKKADLGISVEENIGLNYYYALPNKLFDYIRAEIPVLVSAFPEMKAIVEKYRIGDYIENHKPEHIAQKIKEILSDTEKIKLYKQNLKTASEELIWEKEEKELLKLINNFKENLK